MLGNEQNGEAFRPYFSLTQKKVGCLSAADKESMIDDMQNLAAALNSQGHDVVPIFDCIRNLRREIIREKING